MGTANERRRYNVTSTLIGLAHTQNDPYKSLIAVISSHFRHIPTGHWHTAALAKWPTCCRRHIQINCLEWKPWYIESIFNTPRPSKTRGEITFPFTNFNGCIVEVWDWIGNFIPHFIMDVITDPGSLTNIPFSVNTQLPTSTKLSRGFIDI